MSNSGLIGILILLIFVVPIVWVIYNSNNKAKKRKTLVKDLCTKNGMSVDKPTQVGNALIGIDFRNKKMFYTLIENIEGAFSIIPTENIVTIHVLEETYPGKEIIQNVILAIDTKEEKYRLKIYDDKSEKLVVTDARACLHEARQWTEQIKPQLI